MNKTKGVTFIELLISLSLLTIILLALNNLNFLANRQAKIAYIYTQANLQMEWLATAMQKADAKMSIALIKRWQQQIQILLPRGKGEVQPNLFIVSWNAHKSACTKQDINLNGCLHYNFNKLLAH